VSGAPPHSVLVVRLPLPGISLDQYEPATLARELEALGWPPRLRAAIGVLLEAPVARISLEWTVPAPPGARSGT
jgi:hypothetical protein